MSVTPLPTPVPTRTDPNNFATRADAFLSALPLFGTELNATVASVNQDATLAVNSSVSATSAANYQGNYDAGTTYTVGQSVSHNDKIFQAKKTNLGITPVGGADWREVIRTDILFYSKVIDLGNTTTPDFDLATGNTFLLETSGTTTPTISNPLALGITSQFFLVVTGGGNHVINWPASVVSNNGVTLPAPGNGDVNIYGFFSPDSGMTFHGVLIGWKQA